MPVLIWMAGAFVLLCAAFILEKKRLMRSRRQLRTVIHVNGIRGKTTTCRMLDAVLRERMPVLTKTTGTDPRILHTDGRDLPIRRLGPANIHEQVRTINLAAREGAKVAVLECMAVRPELQRISEEQIVHADIAVITNVRYDHVLEIGDSLQAIAASLAGMIPYNGKLYTADEAFFPFFAERAAARNSAAVLCRPENGDDANAAIVRAIAVDMGLTEAEIDAGLAHVQADPGMEALYTVSGNLGTFHLLNLFAANDPQSALERLRPFVGAYNDIRFVYNNRLDRPDRLELFASRFFPAYPKTQVMLLGDAYPLARRLLLRHSPGLRVARAAHWKALLDTSPGTLLVGLGNTKGEAMRMLDTLRGGKEDAA